jgi:hypothetical protein
MSIEKQYNDITQQQKQLKAKQDALFELAQSSQDVDDRVWFNQQIKKAEGSGKVREDNIDYMDSYNFDPYYHHTFEAFNYMSTYKSLSFSELRLLSNTWLIEAIVKTRQDQASEYSKPSVREGQKGWIIDKKRHYISPNEPLKEEDFDEIKRISEFMWNCGQDDNNLNDNFDKFLRKVIEDSLVLDNASVEKIRTRTNKFFGFQAVDGATIYRAKPYNNPKYRAKLNLGNLPPTKDNYYPEFCQVFQDSDVKVSYYPDEMFVIQRNPTTDIHKNGYGQSELETLVPYLNWLWYSDEHNGNFFTNGSAPKGFFTMADGSHSRIKDFKQQYSHQNKATRNSHKLLIFSGDIKWNDMQKSNRDMEYENWKNYLVKLVCSNYRIDPAEVSFSFKNSGVYGANDKEMRKHSQEKGLIPMLKTIEDYINKYIISELNSDFVFRFVGFDSDSKTDLEKAELELKTTKTINELRKEKGLPELEGEEYNTVLAPVLVQIKQVEISQAQFDIQNDFPSISDETKEEISDTLDELNIE